MPLDQFSSPRFARAMHFEARNNVSGGGVNLRVIPGKQYRLTNVTNSVEVRVISPNDAGTTLLQLFAPTTPTGTFTVPLTSSTVWIGGIGATQDVILEPIWTGVSAAGYRSLMSFVLEATDSNPRALIGTFFDIEGRELTVDGTNLKNQFTLIPTATPQLLFTLGFADGMMLMPDAFQFIGTLVGGPIRVVRGSPKANPSGGTINTNYDPINGAQIINPGPVRLGGEADDIWQPATNPGYMDTMYADTALPAASATTNDGQAGGETLTIATGQTSITRVIEVDFTSCALGIFFLRYKHGTFSGTVTIKAQRITKALSTVAVWRSNVVSVEEVFSFPNQSQFEFNHIELDQGLYHIAVTFTGLATQALTEVRYLTQRFQ